MIPFLLTLIVFTLQGQSGTSSIEGVVVISGTSRPVARSHVTIVGPRLAQIDASIRMDHAGGRLRGASLRGAGYVHDRCDVCEARRRRTCGVMLTKARVMSEVEIEPAPRAAPSWLPLFRRFPRLAERVGRIPLGELIRQKSGRFGIQFA